MHFKILSLSCSMLSFLLYRMHKLKTQGTLFGQSDAWSCTWTHIKHHSIHLYTRSQRWTAHSDTGKAFASNWTYTECSVFFWFSSCRDFSSQCDQRNLIHTAGNHSAHSKPSLASPCILLLKHVTGFFVMMCSHSQIYTFSSFLIICLCFCSLYVPFILILMYVEPLKRCVLLPLWTWIIINVWMIQSDWHNLGTSFFFMQNDHYVPNVCLYPTTNCQQLTGTKDVFTIYWTENHSRSL